MPANIHNSFILILNNNTQKFCVMYGKAFVNSFVVYCTFEHDLYRVFHHWSLLAAAAAVPSQHPSLSISVETNDLLSIPSGKIITEVHYFILGWKS